MKWDEYSEGDIVLDCDYYDCEGIKYDEYYYDIDGITICKKHIEKYKKIASEYEK